MQDLLEETWEDMPVRRETKEEIAQEVKNQLALAIESLKPKGWRTAVFELRQWGVLAANIAVIVALLALAAAAIYQAIARVDKEARFETRTEDRLRAIEAQLLNLRAAQSAGAVLKDLNRADPKTFAQALPALRKVSEQPVSIVNPDPAILREINYKLRNVAESSPDYWPTVLQFIQFASSAMTPPTDVPPPETPYLTMISFGCLNMPPGGHCVKASHRAILLDGGNIPNSVFDHCRVKFTENPVGLSGTTFINCVFEMPVLVSPSPYLREAVKILLASNLINVSFPKS